MSTSRMSMGKTLTQFPIFTPLPPPHHRTATTEIRFSRWNNANADKFRRHEATQKHLEDQIRLEKRYDSALRIAHNYNPAPPHPTTFKSTGTPSSPSSPSIPGKSSKYSKPPNTHHHPAFKPLVKPLKIPKTSDSIHYTSPKHYYKSKNPKTGGNDSDSDHYTFSKQSYDSSATADDENDDDDVEEVVVKPSFRIDEKGLSYEFPDAPFEYQYSYTETPKVKPLKLREPLVSPFGPGTMPKPWLGRKPLPPSKKVLPEFDSFRLPPPHKKGVKPVQAPGPFVVGSGPRYAMSREEVLGEPLTKEEVEELVKGCRKTKRQLNMGRDGLTHNMLDNIHAHWKRRRVCKIKCKGVCTVDMDNVRQQLEERTGGKVIYSKGGIIYLFRGRNYNYKTRPRFPLMLWKPAAPVYPRLIRRVPEGLTLEEATEMRRIGRNLIPICKLAKNGVYCDIAKNVREAFEACELVRIDCQGLEGSDYKKIGAKLKDLVPCVLLSFENEHILLWRGHDWKSSLSEPKDSEKKVKQCDLTLENRVDSPIANIPDLAITEPSSSTYINEDSSENEPSIEYPAFSNETSTNKMEESPSHVSLDENSESRMVVDGPAEPESRLRGMVFSKNVLEFSALSQKKLDKSSHKEEIIKPTCLTLTTPWTEEVLLLRNEAVENGLAVVLDDNSLDADMVFERAVAFAQTAPAGPEFRRRPKKDVEQEGEKRETEESEREEEACEGLGTEIEGSGRKTSERKSLRNEKMKDKADYLNVVPQGSLRIDELAKLLA